MADLSQDLSQNYNLKMFELTPIGLIWCNAGGNFFIIEKNKLHTI